MIKKIILSLLLLLSLSISKDFDSISLSEFSRIVSVSSKFNIVVSDTVEKDLDIYLSNFNLLNSKITFKLLIEILKLNNLSYRVVENVIIIYDKSKIKKDTLLKNDFVIKFNNLSNDDLKIYFDKLYPNLKFVVLRGRILFNSDVKTYKNISKHIKQLDNSYLSKKINITVLSTSNKNLKDLGVDFSYVNYSVDKYISLLTSQVTFPTVLNNKSEFYSLIRLLQEKKLSSILSNPQITISDQKNSSLESTTTIPYITNTTTIQDGQSTTSQTYNYKDVGLKIYFTNVSVNNNAVNFDIEIFIQNVLDNSLTPTTSNKHIKTHCTLFNDTLFFLGGLNDTIDMKTVSNIPLIENIPLLNKITERENTTKENLTFSILISLTK